MQRANFENKVVEVSEMLSKIEENNKRQMQKKVEEDEQPFISPQENEFMPTQMKSASPQKEATTSQKNLPLEGEYIIKNISIQDGNVSRNDEILAYHDMPIEALSLSARSYNALRRAGFSMISDLVQLKYSSLHEIRNMGKKSVSEIVEKLNAYFDSYELQDFYEKSKTDSGKSDDAQMGETYSVLLDSFAITIENSDLSKRTKNCLLRNGICTVEQLINAPIETILSFRNCGAKTINEIEVFINNTKLDRNINMISFKKATREISVDQESSINHFLDELKNCKVETCTIDMVKKYAVLRGRKIKSV